MVTRPVIFVSAVSKELKSARQLVANTLHFLGYEPVWQDVFGSEQGDLREVLRKKIDASQGVVHLVGQCYGAEPPAIDAQFGRVSYAQYEALYARQQGRKVWILLLDDTFTTDRHEPESDDLRALQSAFRERIRADLLLYHPLENSAALEANVLKLRDELALLRRRGKQWAALILALLVLCIWLGVWMLRKQTGTDAIVTDTRHGVEEIKTIVADPAVLRAKLEDKIDETFERKRRELLAAKAPPPEIDALYRWRDRAKGQVAEGVAFITARAADPKSPIISEAVQRLNERGVNAALEFLDATLKAERQRRKEEGRQLAEASLMKAGLHESRFETAEQERAIREALADAPDWWKPHNALGVILLRRAEWQPAEQEFEAARKSMPAEGESTVLNNLAHLYQDTNRLAEAEPLLERALRIDEKSYGPEHPAVAGDLNNLALLYQATNRLAEAESMIERALKIDEKSYGPEHPRVATDLNNLAQLYQATNRLAEAEPLMERALKIDEKSYGPEHPDVAGDLNNLAQLYKDTNRLAEAEPRSRRTVVILLKSSRAAGHVVPHLDLAITNYKLLLIKMTVPEAEVSQRLTAAGREAAYTPPEMAALLAKFFGPFDVAVTQVLPEGQGPGLGIRVGDVVRRYNGEAITKFADLVKLVGEVKGEAIPLEIQRGDETLGLTAKPGRLGLGLEDRPKPPAK